MSVDIIKTDNSIKKCQSLTIDLFYSPIEEAVDAIKESIKEYFFKGLEDDYFPIEIENEVENYLSEMKDGLACIIEYPYVDKVYRNSFYNYYSSKHYTYQRDCIRVSIFESEISAEYFFDADKYEILGQKYLGYFIVRPTTHSIIGRSNLSPKAFQENNYKICNCKVISNISGIRLESDGFPHSSQDGETMKCAETTIWAIMEYFSSRYHEYAPVLPLEIHQALKRFSYQRQLPSTGLTMDQISFALKEFGFGTKLYFSKSFHDLNEIIDSYIESGIPIITGLQSGPLGHVIIIVGKQYKEFHWKDVLKSKFNFRGEKIKYYDASNIPNKYVVQDDNLSPYRIIDLDNPGENYIDEDFKKFQIDGIVVPLYPKIYLESVIAKELVLQILNDSILGYDFKSNFVLRFFLTSCKSLKNHITSLSRMNDILKINLQLARMPKFIWCAEIYRSRDFKESKLACGLIILDATEANKDSIDTLLFAGYPDRCISVNENKFVTLQQKFTNYSYFSNLK